MNNNRENTTYRNSLSFKALAPINSAVIPRSIAIFTDSSGLLLGGTSIVVGEDGKTINVDSINLTEALVGVTWHHDGIESRFGTDADVTFVFDGSDMNFNIVDSLAPNADFIFKLGSGVSEFVIHDYNNTEIMVVDRGGLHLIKGDIEIEYGGSLIMDSGSIIMGDYINLGPDEIYIGAEVNITFGGHIDIGGIDVSGDVDVDGSLDVAINLIVGGNTTLSSILANSVLITDANKVISRSADLTFIDDTLSTKNITVANNITLSYVSANCILFTNSNKMIAHDSDLTYNNVSNTLSMGSATLSNNITVGNYAIVGGGTQKAGAKMTVNGSTHLSSDLLIGRSDGYGTGIKCYSDAVATENILPIDFYNNKADATCYIRIGQQTITTGNTGLMIFKSDGTYTVNHALYCNNDLVSHLCANNGTLAIGTTNNTTAKVRIYEPGTLHALEVSSGTGHAIYVKNSIPFVVTNTGRIGIGKTNPEGLITVRCNSTLMGYETDATRYGLLLSAEGQSSTTASCGIAFAENQSVKAAIIAYDEGSSAKMGLKFYTYDGSALNQNMQINHIGRMMIGRGNTSGTALLQITETSVNTLELRNTGNGHLLYADISVSPFIIANNGDTMIGYVTPQESSKLSVSGNIYMGGYLSIEQNKGISLYGDDGVGEVPTDANLFIDWYKVGDGNAQLVFGRRTVTTKTISMSFFVGNNSSSVNHRIICNNDANSYFCANNGSLSVGIAGNTTAKMRIYESGTRNALQILNTGTGNSVLIENVSSDPAPFVITKNGSVGIGVAEPTSPLHVTGTARFDGYIRLGGGNRIINTGTDRVYIETIGSSMKFAAITGGEDNILVIRKEGTIGIGTSTPAAKLHVVQTAAADCFRVDDQAGDTTYFNINQHGAVFIGNAQYIGASRFHVSGASYFDDRIYLRNNVGICAYGTGDGTGLYQAFEFDNHDGAATHTIRFFRSSNTTGNVEVSFHISNNTTSYNHILRCNNNNTSALCVNNGQLSIGTTSSHSSAILNVSSTTRGVLITSMTTAQMNAISSPANGLLIYNTTDSAFMYYNGSEWSQVGGGGGSSTGRVPAIYYPTPPTPSEHIEIGAQLANYITNINAQITKLPSAYVKAYTDGVAAVTSTYSSGVYSPTQNRIYLIPYYQATQSQWHYIDCNTGNVTAYTHGVTAVNEAYMGGVYSPTQNRIYLMPFRQAIRPQWHYIDCNTGDVVAYARGVAVVNKAYSSGVYSPTQNRIYLVPYNQASQSKWHYIDCNTENVIAYNTHGVTAVDYAYSGGVYFITQNRIYLMPYIQALQSQWHYIDCETGDVIAYTHGVIASNSAYQGGVYSPTQNRIYLIPHTQASQLQWHYIDCNTGNVIAYTHGVTAVTSAYYGGVYSPTQNRIYLVPYNQASQSQWHYIDCNTGNVIAYTHGVIALNSAYIGGVYSPTQNRIYFMASNQASQSQWHYIDEYSNIQVDKFLMAGAIFNKF